MPNLPPNRLRYLAQDPEFAGYRLAVIRQAEVWLQDKTVACAMAEVHWPDGFIELVCLDQPHLQEVLPV